MSDHQKEKKMLSGDIQWNDPMIAKMGSTLFKNTIYYGLKGLFNFGRAHKPKNKSIQESIKRVSNYESKYISSIWISWSFIIVPTTAISYFLWNPPISFKNGLVYYTDTLLSNINTSTFPLHEYYIQFTQSNICKNYINLTNISKLLSISTSILTSFLILTASALNYNAPTPKQPYCQSNGNKHLFYPYYNTIELQKYTDNIWISQMPFVFESMQFGIRMVVILLDKQNNNVLVYSPTPLTNTTLETIEKHKWNIKYLIAPNSIHHLFMKEWIDKFENIIVIGPPNLKQRRKDINFDYILDIDVNDNEWNVMNIPNELKNKYSNVIDFMVIKTGIFHEEIVIFHRLSKTLIVGDHIENMGYQPETNLSEHFTLGKQFLLRLGGMNERPSAPSDMKMATNLKYYRKSVEKVIEWDFNKIVPSHGRMIENNAKDVYIAANAFVF